MITDRAAGPRRPSGADGDHQRQGPARLPAVTERLVWIDCEMTGLDLGNDALIEVAALVTDPDLNVLGDGVDVVIHADDAAAGRDGRTWCARCTRSPA